MYSTDVADKRARGASAPRIAVFAFGRKGYIYGAANLAISIKEYTDAHIHLFAQASLLKYLPDFHRGLFDVVEILDPDNFTTLSQTDPGKCKARIYDLLPDGDWLYVDADTLCLGPLDSLWQGLVSDGRSFICEVIEDYTPWASPEKIRAKVGSDGASVYGVQTSWMFIRKTSGEDHLCSDVIAMHDGSTWRRSELDHQWGRSMPDELLYSTACAKRGYDPSGPRLTFYGKEAGRSQADVALNYRFLSLYGNGRGKTLVRKEYVEWYDPLLWSIYRSYDQAHMFKVNFIQQDKYLG